MKFHNEINNVKNVGARRPVKVSPAKLRKVLHQTFGLKEFRPGQEEVIQSVLSRKNTLVVMPTGAGKSLCYQLPALLIPGTTIVISPLISLMKDQTQKLADLELSAHELNSAVSDLEKTVSLKAAKNGSAEFIYTTPEQFVNDDFLSQLKNVEIDLVVIDEAHCLTQWGHDFRPAYLDIKHGLRALKNPPVLALTATATEEVVEDIKKQLELLELEHISTCLVRKNLFYQSFQADDDNEKMKLLEKVIEQIEGQTIIYASTVKTTEFIYETLRDKGYQIQRYHGKMKMNERHVTQASFMDGSAKVLVATNAFGLGIDKPDIRSVIHFNFPGTIEAYYQESGRAGRDGNRAHCTLLYLRKDKSTQSFFLAGRYPKLDDLQRVYDVLVSYKNASALVTEPLADVITSSQLILQLANLSKKRVTLILSALVDKKIVQRVKNRGYRLLRTDLTELQLAKVSSDYEDKKKNDADKLKKMISYAQTALCRWKTILHYFGEDAKLVCSHCDNCIRDLSRVEGGTPQDVLIEA